MASPPPASADHRPGDSPARATSMRSSPRLPRGMDLGPWPEPRGRRKGEGMASSRRVPGGSPTGRPLRPAAVEDAGPSLHNPVPVHPGAVRAEPFVLLATKLTPPRVRDEIVTRGRLLDRLDSGADARLTLIACPAGFGKTSLLASWYAARAGGSPMGWLTLDKATTTRSCCGPTCSTLFAGSARASRNQCPGQRSARRWSSRCSCRAW